MLALQNQTTPGEPDLLIRSPADAADAPESQVALSVPVSVPVSERALGESLQTFFEACGGMQTISLSARRLDNPAPADRHLFRQPFFVIGRASKCDLVIPDPKASFRHIYVQLVSGRWFFLNLAKISRSPAGKGQPESGWFDVDCQLTVGSHVVTHVAMGRQAVTRKTAISNAEPSFDPPFFELDVMNREQGSQEPPSRQFRGPVTLIGASRKCDLFLKDESVSKVHASLVLTPHGMWVVDLLGRGGVSVDGSPAFWKRIHHGTVLQIGQYRLRVRCDGSRITPSVRIETRVAAGHLPLPLPGSVSGGSMSEGAVLALIGQLAEMQNQFFEQSRLQMQWMSEMMAHVGRAQQESARRDIARIEEIGRELREIKSQIAGAASRAPSTPIGERDNLVTRLLLEDFGTPERQARLPAHTTSPSPDVVVQPGPEPAATDFQTARFQPFPQPFQESSLESLREPINAPLAGPLPGPLTPAAEVPRPVAQNAADARKAPATASPVDAHAWLTQRMATLSQEHTSLWRRLMNTLAGRPNA